jgi:hypothetical protein
MGGVSTLSPVSRETAPNCLGVIGVMTEADLDNHGRKVGENLLDTVVGAMAKEGSALAVTKVMTTLALEKPSKKPALSEAPLTRVMTATTLDTQSEDSDNGQLQRFDINYGDTIVGIGNALTDKDTVTSVASEEMVRG